MRYDLHLHSHYSKDAINKPRDIVKYFKKNGMDFAITDHNNAQAWREIKKYSRQYKVECVFGEEIMVFDNGKYIGEFIGLFLNKEVKPGQYEEVLEELEKQSALISVPHPFDALRKPVILKPMFREKKRAKYILKRIHAIEGYNSRVLLQGFNKKACSFARQYSLALTGGSDAHFPQELGNGYTEIPGSTKEELFTAIKKRQTTCNGILSSPIVHLLTQIRKRTNLFGEK